MANQGPEGRGFGEKFHPGSSGISIATFSSAQLTDDMLDRFRLPELVARGYGSKLTGDVLFNHTRNIYGISEGTTYLALSEGVAVGSLTFSQLRLDPKDRRGALFWLDTASNDPVFGRRAGNYGRTHPLIAVHGQGVVTLPERRREGIHRQLVRHWFTDVQPTAIIAETNSPAAVTTLATAGKEEGYRTFFGETEVTPETHEKNVPVGGYQIVPHKGLLKAHLTLITTSLRMKPLDGGIFAYLEGEMPPIPDSAGFSSIIQKAFEPLIAKQHRMKAFTLRFPLISVKKELLPE